MYRHRRRAIAVALAGFLAVAVLTGCEPVPPAQVFVVTAFADGLDRAVGDGVCEVTEGVGDCSLRAAVAEANAAPRGSVTVRAGTYRLTVADPDDGDPDLDVTGSVEVNWNRRENVIVNGPTSRVLDVHAGGSFSAHGIRLANASNDAHLDVVRVAGTLILGESSIWGGVELNAEGTVPALEIAEGATVMVSNVEVSGTGGPAVVVNEGTLQARFSSIAGVSVPGLHTGASGSTVIGATRVAYLQPVFRGQPAESPTGAACTGSLPGSLGYNRVPNTSCGLDQPSDAQDPSLPWVDVIPVGALGCGEGYDIDISGTARPGDGDFDGTPLCDIGPVERGVHITIGTSQLPAGIQGSCYSGRLTGGSTTSAITWSVTGLPPGLSLVGDRVVGIPAEAGSFPIVITARAIDGGGMATKTIVIAPSTDPPMVSC